MAQKNKRRVTFANNWTDRASGDVFQQGKTYEVDEAVGRLAVYLGKARPASADEKTTSRPKAADDSAQAQK